MPAEHGIVVENVRLLFAAALLCPTAETPAQLIDDVPATPAADKLAPPVALSRKPLKATPCDSVTLTVWPVVAVTGAVIVPAELPAEPCPPAGPLQSPGATLYASARCVSSDIITNSCIIGGGSAGRAMVCCGAAALAGCRRRACVKAQRVQHSRRDSLSTACAAGLCVISTAGRCVAHSPAENQRVRNCILIPPQ